jgi:hypothetical protein
MALKLKPKAHLQIVIEMWQRGLRGTLNFRELYE